MQPVNDDMDNLFRRAAQDYPLNIQPPNFDFEKVRWQMNAENNLPPEKGHKQRNLWVIFLLFPLSFITEHHFQKGSNGKATTSLHHTAPGNRTTAQSRTDPSTSTVATSQIPLEDGRNTTPAPAADITTNPTPGPVIKDRAPAENTTLYPAEKPTQPATQHTLKNTSSYKRRSQYRTVKNDNGFQDPGNSNLPYAFTPGNEKNGNHSLPATGINPNGKDGKKIALETEPEVVEADSTATKFAGDSTGKSLSKLPDTTAAGAVTKPVEKDTVSNTETAEKKNIKQPLKSKPYLYVGVAAGPDVSFVKSSRTSGVGYNAGLVVGYRFNKRLALQTGIIWNYKKYYADGKYVNIEKLNLPNHTEVIYIDGHCSMIELPLELQYYFNHKKRQSWYASAGVSSYIMKLEDYYYLYKRYNNPYYSDKEYKNATRNWLSVLQLSAGYQLHLKGKGSLLAAPYIKLPIAKLGIAQLPLSSAGINIGYTLPLQ